MRHQCLCEKGWVLTEFVDAFPRRCILCEGRGYVTDYILRERGLMPTPPYTNMGPVRAQRFLDAYAVAWKLFKLQSAAPQGVHEALWNLGPVTWPFMLKTATRLTREWYGEKG